MLEVKTISVGGFRNVEITKICLHRITSLLATNNYGKSNIIRAIDFGFDYLHTMPKTRNKMMGWRKVIPLNPKLQKSPFHFEVEIENDRLENHRFIRYGFEFEWYNDISGTGRILDEFIETRETTSVKYTSFLKRSEGKYRQGKSTTSFKKIRLDENVLAIDLLELFSDEEISKVAALIKEVKLSICDSLDADQLYEGVPIEFSDREARPFESPQVPKILYDLKENDQERYSLLLETIYELFPEFTEIQIEYIKIEPSMVKTIGVGINPEESIVSEINVPFRISDGIYRLMLKSEYLNQPVSIEMMSAGTKRVVWLLVNLFAARYTGVSIFAIEEIETSIHPKLIKRLLEIINDLSSEVSVIITSHSPLLVQYLKPETLYIGKNNQYGCATFRNLKRTKLAALKNAATKSGMNIGEFIFDVIANDMKSSSILNTILEE